MEITMRFSIEVDKYSATSLVYCLNELQNNISDFDEWRIVINAGGIDYGIYLNINTDRQKIEISNQPNGDGSDSLYDVIEYLESENEEEEE